MLPGDDMLHVECCLGKHSLRQATILATIASASANRRLEGFVHEPEERPRIWRALFWKIPTRSITSTKSRYSARSASEIVPSFAFSASSPIRERVSGSIWKSTIFSADSRVKQSARGFKMRSNALEAGAIMQLVYQDFRRPAIGFAG